jgi:hypothetical protein
MAARAAAIAAVAAPLRRHCGSPCGAWWVGMVALLAVGGLRLLGSLTKNRWSGPFGGGVVVGVCFVVCMVTYRPLRVWRR